MRLKSACEGPWGVGGKFAGKAFENSYLVERGVCSWPASSWLLTSPVCRQASSWQVELLTVSNALEKYSLLSLSILKTPGVSASSISNSVSILDISDVIMLPVGVIIALGRLDV